MRRKVPQDYANTTCDIAAGWRLAGGPRDFERLVELQQGELVIDLLTGDTSIEGTQVEPFWIAGELTAWFRERCALLHKDLGYLFVIDGADQAYILVGRWMAFEEADCDARIAVFENRAAVPWGTCKYEALVRLLELVGSGVNNIVSVD